MDIFMNAHMVNLGTFSPKYCRTKSVDFFIRTPEHDFERDRAI